MPYIEQVFRPDIDRYVESLDSAIQTGGDLNYAVTRLVLRLINRQGVTYTNIRAALGDLNESAEEIRRRLLAPYENSKKEKHGDVPEFMEMIFPG